MVVGEVPVALSEHPPFLTFSTSYLCLIVSKSERMSVIDSDTGNISNGQNFLSKYYKMCVFVCKYFTELLFETVL